jgi:hypothetical protein
VDLPVGEPNPPRRVQRVRHTMAGHKAAGPFCGPGALSLLADWLPAAFHRLAARPIARATPLLFDTTVTTVPLPDVPLHRVRPDGLTPHRRCPCYGGSVRHHRRPAAALWGWGGGLNVARWCGRAAHRPAP